MHQSVALRIELDLLLAAAVLAEPGIKTVLILA